MEVERVKEYRKMAQLAGLLVFGVVVAVVVLALIGPPKVEPIPPGSYDKHFIDSLQWESETQVSFRLVTYCVNDFWRASAALIMKSIC